MTAALTTTSTWGNYGILLDGLDIDVSTVQGVILETSDGSVYGLQHLDNIWLDIAELAFSVEEFQDPKTNIGGYQRFEDMQGKTITKLTYLIANADDITIDTSLYCKELLSEDYSITTEESSLVESGLTEGDVSFNGTNIVVDENENGLTIANYIQGITAVTVNEIPLSGQNLGTAIFNEDGSVNLDAVISGKNGETALFEESGTYTLHLEASGYPTLEIEITK